MAGTEVWWGCFPNCILSEFLLCRFANVCPGSLNRSEDAERSSAGLGGNKPSCVWNRNRVYDSGVCEFSVLQCGR